METDIKCGECCKGTRHFKLGKIFYSTDNLSETIMGKNRTICPKCKKDISNKKCLVKTHEINNPTTAELWGMKLGCWSFVGNNFRTKGAG